MLKTIRRRRSIEAERLFDVPWLLAPTALRTLVASHQATAVARSEEYDDDEEQEEGNYPISEGVACISVCGVLTKSRYSNTTAYRDLAANISHALNNSKVGAILLAVDSPGGETGDLFDLADAIYSARSIKPIAAIAADSCYSAAFCLASSAEKLFVTRTGGTGSVGCWMAHTNYAGALQQAGVEIEFIYSGERKVDANPTEPLSNIAREALQKEVDRIRTMFVQTVSRNRGVSEAALFATEAACFMSNDGVPLLCDEVGTVADAAAYLRSQIQSVSPRSATRFLPAAISLPGPESMVFVQDRDEMAGLCASAFGEGGRGWAERSLSHAASMERFGRPGVVLAVRGFPQCRASAPINSGRRISLLVAPYDNSTCNLGGGLKERYAPGCFSMGLNQDPKVLWGHHEQHVLGRKSAGTGRFWESSAGLHAEADVPLTSFGDDVLELLRVGNINQCSAAFWILQSSIEQRGNERVRVVERAVLRDASVLSFPAYENTVATIAQLPAAGDAAASSLSIHRAKLRLLEVQ